MLTLKEYRNQIDPLMKLESQYRSKINQIKKKLEKFRNKHSYVCNKCKMVFSKKELGYRKYLIRWLDVRYQPMGDYDQTQKERIEHVLCCPKCGRSFNEVIYKNVIWVGKSSSRYEDKPSDFKYPATCKKLISKEIFKQ